MTASTPRLLVDSTAPTRAALQGMVTVYTAAALLDPGRRWLAAAPKGAVCELDLGAVTQGDSAALALLLDWLRAAAAAGRVLEIRHLPASLQAMLPILGLDALLSPTADGALRPRLAADNSGTIPGLA